MKNIQKKETFVYIGANVEKKTLKAITNAILKILAVKDGDEVKKAALNVLTSAYEVKNVSITGCTFKKKE